MTSTHTIEGKDVVIDWKFSYQADDLQIMWALWVVEGTGNDGKNYVGGCEAHKNLPENWHDSVLDIEEVTIKNQN